MGKAHGPLRWCEKKEKRTAEIKELHHRKETREIHNALIFTLMCAVFFLWLLNALSKSLNLRS